jgi:hypothetical protein
VNIGKQRLENSSGHRGGGGDFGERGDGPRFSYIFVSFFGGQTSSLPFVAAEDRRPVQRQRFFKGREIGGGGGHKFENFSGVLVAKVWSRIPNVVRGSGKRGPFSKYIYTHFRLTGGYVFGMGRCILT